MNFEEYYEEKFGQKYEPNCLYQNRLSNRVIIKGNVSVCCLPSTDCKYMKSGYLHNHCEVKK